MNEHFASTADFVADLLQARQTVLPKRLGLPGPSTEQFHAILGAAAHAPDHGCLLPWRFILVPDAAREALGDAFAQALRERDSQANVQQQDQAREKAFRAPVLLLLVVDEQCGNPGIPAGERLISAGCAIQNVLLMATALGFGSALTSGKALQSTALRTLFALGEYERAHCFVSIGSVQSRKGVRARPEISRFVATLVPGQGVLPLLP